MISDRKTREEIHSLARRYRVSAGTTPEMSVRCELCRHTSEGRTGGSITEPLRRARALRRKARVNGVHLVNVENGESDGNLSEGGPDSQSHLTHVNCRTLLFAGGKSVHGLTPVANPVGELGARKTTRVGVTGLSATRRGEFAPEIATGVVCFRVQPFVLGLARKHLIGVSRSPDGLS